MKLGTKIKHKKDQRSRNGSAEWAEVYHTFMSVTVEKDCGTQGL